MKTPDSTWPCSVRCVRYVRLAREALGRGNVPRTIQLMGTAWHEHGVGMGRMGRGAWLRRWKQVMDLLIKVEGELIQVVCAHANHSRRAA